MITENKLLMKQALESLKGKWGLTISAFLVYLLIVMGVSLVPFAGGVIVLFIGGAFALGISIFSLSISRGTEARLEQIFQGFNRYGTSLAAYLLVGLFTALWTLLLIVPGIIAALSYSMTYYIIADDDSISATEAIDKSKELMYGYKWKLFCLELRFIGWALLGILTLGIGYLWLGPYIQISVAKFYDDIKAAKSEEITPTSAN